MQGVIVPAGVRATVEPSVLFCARLMPPKAVGGQERLSADVLQTLQAHLRVVDLSNRRGKPFQWPYLATLLPRLRLHRGDVVDGSDGSLAGPLALSGKPAVLRLNGLDVALANPVYQRYARRYLPRIPAIVANSAATRDRAVGLGVDPARIHLVNPMAGVAPPTPSGIPRVPGRILFVGRLVPKKGLLEFLDQVWPEVARRDREASLHIVGDGPLRDDLQARLGPLGPRVRWLGRVGQPDLEREFAQASLLAMASRPLPGDFEGFGIVSIEAAMRGVPVVAYPTDGVPDAVLHERTGILLPDFDAQGAAAAYVAALHDPVLQDASRVRREADERWGPKRFAREYLRVVDIALRG